MIKRLVVIGASNALREVKGIVAAINLVQPTYEIIGALDDSEELLGTEVAGVPVIGPLSIAVTLPSDLSFVFAIGSQSTQLVRDQLFLKIGVNKNRFPAIVHPKADIDPTAEIGHGCIVHSGACMGPESQLCDFAILAVNSALGPSSMVREFAMVTSLVLVLSRAVVGRMAFIGSMTCVLEDIQIGDFSRVGVGSIVTRNIPKNAIAMGNPARVLGKN